MYIYVDICIYILYTWTESAYKSRTCESVQVPRDLLWMYLSLGETVQLASALGFWEKGDEGMSDWSCFYSLREREFLLTSYGKSNKCAKILIKWSPNNFVKTTILLFEREINFHHEPSRFLQGYFFKLDVSESNTIISKIFGAMRIFLT